MKCLVIGGVCPLGQKLVDLLVKQGCVVVVWDDFSLGTKEYLNSKAKYFFLTIPDCVPNSTSGYSLVFDVQDMKIVSKHFPHRNTTATFFSSKECENFINENLS